jgi:hypothetical protein
LPSKYEAKTFIPNHRNFSKLNIEALEDEQFSLLFKSKTLDLLAQTEGEEN